MHHALALTVGSTDVRKLDALDAETPEPGWNCPGGIFGSFKSGLGGSFFEPQRFEGRGFQVDPGDRVVLTVHYSLPASGTFVADQTAVELRTQLEPVTPIVTLSIYNPSWLLGGMPIAPRCAQHDVQLGRRSCTSGRGSHFSHSCGEFAHA